MDNANAFWYVYWTTSKHYTRNDVVLADVIFAATTLTVAIIT